jgi:eukaryotic-like serine/threonine-protein kinase
MASRNDTQLGQLVIARGLVSLPTLLKCVARGGTLGAPLSEVLVSDGLLSAGQVDELEAYLASTDRAALREEFDHSDTLVMDELFEPETRTDAYPAVDRDSVDAVGSTLDHPPPEQLGPRTEPRDDPADDLPRLDLSREERYEFVDELGRGGMGQVMLAVDRLLNREIALKTLLSEATNAADSRRRLLQEAQVTGKLEHPSIIPIYDLGELSNREPYYTMRVVRERSLDQIIVEMSDTADHGYSLTQLISILRQVCLAVHYAHDQGIVHRDLKPENILIGAYGEVFVIDWGVAKVITPGDQAAMPSLGNPDQAGALIGTPQYMAPEQAKGAHDAIDQRTDVYALGAILYDVLTLTPVFTADHILSLLFKAIEEPPQPPSQRAPERSIPRELEEICLKALAKDPDQRYQTAEEMADDLELFLEGVKERERRRAMAQEAIEAADEARSDYQAAQREHVELLQQLSHERLNITSWASHDEKEHVWELEQRVEDLQVELERRFSEATRLYGQALVHLPEMQEARKALADLYWERFQEAQAAGDRARATYFEGLVRQYNDGWYDQLLEGKAYLTVLTEPAPASVTLFRFEEINRRLIERKVADLGQTPVSNLELQYGSYVLELSAPGYVTLQVPFQLDRMEENTLDIRLYRADEIPEDFVVVPGGPFLSGELQPHNLDENIEYLPDFAIMKYPVTCGEYLEFLNALAADDLDRATKHAPRLEDGESYFPITEAGQFELPTDDAEGDAWEMNWPICMMSYNDAVAYARWRSQRDGRAYRLPSAAEWEKAARGVDGRLYPWGNHFDPSFCRMRDSERGKPMPVSVDSYKMDRSPYGVRHMGGNVIDWTTTPTPDGEDRRIVQGGSYNSIPLMCRLDWHMDSQEDFRWPFFGFRLALAL